MICGLAPLFLGGLGLNRMIQGGKATYSATPLLRSLVFRPQGVILVIMPKKRSSMENNFTQISSFMII